MRRADAAEAELEAAGLAEMVVRGQADRLAGRGNRAVPVKHLLPAVHRAGRVFRFDHGLVKVTQGGKCLEVGRQPGCCGPVEAAALSRRHVEFRLNHSGGGETDRTSSNLAISPNIDRKLYSGRLNFNIAFLRLVK